MMEACEWNDSSSENDPTIGSCWEVCAWSDSDTEDERDVNLLPIVSESSSDSPVSAVSVEKGLGDTTSWSSTPPRGAQTADFTASPPVRTSPRVPKPKTKFDPSSAVRDDEGWQLMRVMELSGCEGSCATAVNDLCEYDVLQAHSSFWGKLITQQRSWLLDYFEIIVRIQRTERKMLRTSVSSFADGTSANNYGRLL